ncbi:hypothetical protein C8Q76DRAFT_761835 [Earliella scabrosa]|nr:hypothetical protein C8Q76DRAFT_761835 [Earliella scabrosa]
MQFKTLITLAGVAAVAVAAPNGKRADEADVSPTLTTHFTTETFTATRVLQSMMTVEPFVTTVTSETTWTVAHTVTRIRPTPK